MSTLASPPRPSPRLITLPEITARTRGISAAGRGEPAIDGCEEVPGFAAAALVAQIIAAARANGVGVMGIRAVQAGALTSAIDRLLPVDHPEMRDFARAAGFRRLADEIGITAAALRGFRRDRPSGRIIP